MSTKEKKRANWTTEQLQAAINSLKSGNLSQREAAHRFNIPRRTLRNHLKSGVLNKKLGRSSLLSFEQEKQFSERIVRLCDIGMPLTPLLIRRSAYRFCVENNIEHPFNNTKGVAGKDWLYGFLKRDPHLSRRKAQLMNPARAQKLNKFIVEDHFTKLTKIFDEMNLHQNPQNLFNMDEKGCRLTIHHQQQVIGQKGTKRVHLVAPEHAENVTIAGCCNALGNHIPPMVIFKGKRLKREWEENLPHGTLVKMAEKGSMTTELFIEFLRHLHRYKGKDPILLIFDGAASHLDISITEAADEFSIRLFCLPSNTTHELQPLDKAVYRSFEHHWDQEVLRFWDVNPDRRLNKCRFGNILSEVWPKCMTPANIINGFRATGLYPLNPSVIPESAFAPSLTTERPIATKTVEDNANIDNMEANETNNNLSEYDGNKCSSDSETDDSEDIPLIQLKTKIQQTAADKINKSIRTPEKNSDAIRSQTINQDFISFSELLPTPELFKLKERNAPKRKSLNYKAQLITKDLFCSTSSKFENNTKLKKQPLASSSKLPVRKNSKGTKKNVSDENSWYCFVCQKTEQLDMRSCVKCGSWSHEVCIGFTKEDKEDYICLACE